jgi:hypothetical protein
MFKFKKCHLQINSRRNKKWEKVLKVYHFQAENEEYFSPLVKERKMDNFIKGYRIIHYFEIRVLN